MGEGIKYLVVAAVALFVGFVAGKGEAFDTGSDGTQVGRYAFEAKSWQMIVRLDTATGEVTHCYRTQEKFICK